MNLMCIAQLSQSGISKRLQRQDPFFNNCFHTLTHDEH